MICAIYKSLFIIIIIIIIIIIKYVKISIRLTLVLMLIFMLMLGPFSLDICTVILPLMLLHLIRITLSYRKVKSQNNKKKQELAI